MKEKKRRKSLNMIVQIRRQYLQKWTNEVFDADMMLMTDADSIQTGTFKSEVEFGSEN